MLSAVFSFGSLSIFLSGATIMYDRETQKPPSECQMQTSLIPGCNRELGSASASRHSDDNWAIEPVESLGGFQEGSRPIGEPLKPLKGAITPLSS